jgi:hypothetical protein
VFTGLVVLTGVAALSGAVLGCSSAVTPGWAVSAPTDDGGSTSTGDGATSGIDSGASSDSAPGSPDATGSDPVGPDADVPETSTVDSSSAADTGVDAGTVTSGDGFGASRAACINKINALRATNTAVALQPYTLQETDALDTCVDTQASTDQSMNSAHYAFINNAPSCTWGSAMGFAQNECERGYGTTPAGIEKCIQSMWDESLKPNCLGCVGCTAFGGACPNCDYSGAMGYECGHYVNLSAPYFTMVACGFAGAAPSSGDGWSVENFE